jgi:hypothetical protein
MINPLCGRMSITSAKQLKYAIDLAVAGNKSILPDIGKFIAYNYYMCFHIKEGSPDDVQNEIHYTDFKMNHPLLYEQVEGWVTFNLRKFEPGYIEPDIF